ncbi:MAG: hypothetical protein IPI92_03830 [Gemmatimonadetes bacterium]|nr:hypothetical protein [Gemmatimonadota bacterium]MBK7783606.1 hypothetical protein [Gemmatimonadota bacterium]
MIALPISARRRAAGLGLALALLTSCEAGLKPNTGFSIEDFITGVTDQSGTVHAVLHRGAPPTASTADSTKVSGIAVVINGGSSPQNITSPTQFTRVIFSVEGLTDYYELTLPAGQTAQGVLVGLSTSATAGQFYFNYAAGDGAGVFQTARQLMRILQIGTGDIQVSVAWTDTADVDLHIVDPDGGHLYFGNKTVPSGGNLDLDANAACSKNTLPDGSQAYVSNENIYWPTGGAPNGSYTIYLDYWSDCGVAQTDWVVTVQQQGASPQVYTGSFVGSSSGMPNDTVAVLTF